MKKIVCIVLAVLILAALAGCSSKAPAETNKKTSESVVTLIEANEYLLYQNIFFNEQGADFAGKEVTKKGTFAVIEDRYNEVTRYYVWGYYDQTKCCDWQWEFVPTDKTSLPAPGSMIIVKGVFEYNEDALDKYWIKDAVCETDTEFIGTPEGEIDMTTMSATLERVQLLNIIAYPDFFEGKTAAFYGRMYDDKSVQHPYYDGSWIFDVTPADPNVPAVGVTVIASGTLKKAVLDGAKLDPTNRF